MENLILHVNSQTKPRAIVNTIKYAMDCQRDIEIIPTNHDAASRAKEALLACKNEYMTTENDGIARIFVSCRNQ